MTTEQKQCGSCGEPIYWLAHQRTRKPAPIEVRTDPTGNILVQIEYGTYCMALPAEKVTYSAYLHLNHFVRCPQAKTWAKAGRA